MFFFNLLLSEKVDLDIDIINNITSIFVSPLRMRKDTLIIGDMQLIDQHFHHLL